MTEILQELIKGNSILIEQSDLEEFHNFISKEPDLYSLRYEYSENMVKITLVEKRPRIINSQL